MKCNFVTREEDQLSSLIQVVLKLEDKSKEKQIEIKDFQETINNILEIMDGYYALEEEVYDFTFDENENQRNRTIVDYRKFTFELYTLAKDILINSSEYQRGFEDGKMYAYQGTMNIIDLEEDVQSYR